MPVRDGARYLEESLLSIAAQTHAAAEVIVVDDGSTDASAEIAARLGARVERQPPTGQSAARNRGVAISQEALIAFLDADDLWPADRLERAVAVLDADPAPDIVFGHVRQFASADNPPEALSQPQPALLFGAMVVRRAALERVGPFATTWRVGELMEWLFRAREANVRELMTDDVVLYRRLHGSNLGREPGDRVDHVRIVREALDRRRGRVGG